MDEKKSSCPICGGTGMYALQHMDEVVESYCSCWRGWLLSQRNANSEMTVEIIPLSEVEHPWGMQEDGEYYGRSDGAFFRIVGVKIRTDKREVEGGWTQPMLEEIGKGIVVLVRSTTTEGIPIFLLTSTPEPGNPADKNFVLLKPSFQASKSNMTQAHKGEKPPLIKLLDKYGNSIVWNKLPQDGGRFLGKINKYGVIEIPTEDMGEIVLSPDARWFQLSEIHEALTSDDVNEHLSRALELEGVLKT